jgi:predicted nucleotidyltransferase/predicted transcriptional regulator with HTH domain
MTTKSIQNDPILEALLTSQARVEILKLLFLISSNRHYLREIATLTKQPIRAVQRELARLESAGLVQSWTEGNRKYFQADRDLSVFPEIRALLMKTAGINELVQQHLMEVADSIHIAFLFGSYASGKKTPSNDIDLMVIGEITSRSLANVLVPARDILGREINPVIMDLEAFRQKVVDKDPFIQNVLREPKIFLIGNEDELREIAKARTAKIN